MANFRYIAALATACLLVAGGFAISWNFRNGVMETVRQNLRTAAAAGQLPKELEGADLDSVSLEGLDTELPASAEWRIFFADLISSLWFIWIPTVFAICFGLAYFFGRSPDASSGS